ncbi:MAG: nucleotidyltransferase [Melioribacteraceae bacterium]|nr:nucleotidyltransferase [Melioribacteraceae bacterium]
MLNNSQKNIILKELLESLELPKSAYEKARDRYKDIGKWLNRADSICRMNEPHIYSQGSFRLGTAVKPLSNEEAYDLDLACELESGITKENKTQKELKHLVGEEIEKYRKFRGIQNKMEEKRRCWRIEYLDAINFHIDIVPCIPENETRRISIKEAMIKNGVDDRLSELVSERTVAITDNNMNPEYEIITDDWKVSNPDGYAKWFESRMRTASAYLTKRAALLQEAQIDDIPVYEWKTPLQLCIQLLKRHRDEMYKNNEDSKPISVIITTLAARAYQGEEDLADAIMNILNRMRSFVNPIEPMVPNPVNPDEDFADKWYDPEYRHLRLQENFNLWLTSAIATFSSLFKTDNPIELQEQIFEKFASKLNAEELNKSLDVSAPTIITERKTKQIDSVVEPWMEE